jgi:hypothetical protein
MNSSARRVLVLFLTGRATGRVLRQISTHERRSLQGPDNFALFGGDPNDIEAVSSRLF